MTIAIYGSRRQNDAVEYVAKFLNVLAERGDKVVMHRKLYVHLLEYIPEELKTVTSVVDGCEFTADLAVSLGGDGTFLRTAAWVGEKEIPIVGVNTGHLGYLAALTVNQLPELPKLIADDYLRIERRSVLEILSPDLPQHVGRYALNDIAVSKEETSSMIQASVSLGPTPLAEYKADGLVICTPTGSTAYNLSVGGPIVQPTLDVNVISPVAAHSLSMRPLVVGADTPITIVPQARTAHIRLALDGRSTLVDTGTPVVVGQAPFKVLVMQVAEHTFAATLRQKLHWGEK